MPKQSDGSHFDLALYPDVGRAGDLCLALQAEFDAMGVPWRARHPSAPGWRYVGADVRDGERHVDALMALSVRSFATQFWVPGVRMIWGATGDLSALAGAIDAWLAGARVRQVASAWPFIKFGGLAEAYERGQAVEYIWRGFLDRESPASHLVRLLPFLAAARNEPRLRELVPFTSHWILGFRSALAYDSGILLWVVPTDDGRYQVKTSDNREVGVADAVGSVAFALDALDADPGVEVVHPLSARAAAADPRPR